MMKSGSGTVARSCGSVGKPRLSLLAGASVPWVSPGRAASVGQRLGGGSVPRITQLRKCTRSAFTVWVWGTGLFGNTPVP